jgi:2Fe-2S ferredoxin
MPHLRVVDRNGVAHEIETRSGLKVMEILRELDYGVAAICGGMCSCATCHIFVAPDWKEKVPPPTPDELALVTELRHATADSRLSCQIEFTEALNNLQVTIAPEG